MHSFEDKVIESTVTKLINGDDYREEVIYSINTVFFDFAINFFKEIVKAKINKQKIDTDWYKSHFILSESFSTEDRLLYSGLNKKTVTNIYRSAKKEIVLDAAIDNYDYLYNLLEDLETEQLDVKLNIRYLDITVELSLAESLIVINALATKKLAIRGGAWSAIGKKVEKPLLDELCKLANVVSDYIDNSHFIKDKDKEYDREVDYKLKSLDGNINRIEVKLMGKGNPESVDVTIARDTNIFVADTLSQQNKNQLTSRNVSYLELKGNSNVLEDFKKILKERKIPVSSE